MTTHSLARFSYSLFGAVLLPLRERAIRPVTVGLILWLVTLGTVANAQLPATPKVAKISICEVLAGPQHHWLNPNDRAAWIEACMGGQVELTNLEVSHELWPGSVRASVDVSAAGPLVDTETIKVAFTVGQRSFPTTGSGTGIRMADVDFDPCLQPVQITAVASWKTKPVGTPARSVDFSKQITMTYQNSTYRALINPAPNPWGYVRFYSESGSIYVWNLTPGQTYTVTNAQLFCPGADGNWRTCQSGDFWSFSSATSLPVNLTCGQSVEFNLEATQDFVPVLVVITYYVVGSYTPCVVSAMIIFEPILPG